MPEVAGDAALLVDPHSIEDIAAKMNMLYESETLRTDLIAKGTKQLKKFSWDKSSQQVYELIREIIE